MFRNVLILLAATCFLAAEAGADACRLESSREVESVRSLVRPDTLIVEFCWYCDGAEPQPLRVSEVDFAHHGPTQVRVTSWEQGASDRQFPLETLEQAERTGSGPLAEFLRARVEADTDTSGYLGPNDPYLVQEKRDRYRMLLGFVREDHEMRTWSELAINGRRADPRLLYVPAGGDRYRSVGYEVGCSMDAAPRVVEYRPVERASGNEAPPQPFVADVTGQCYDGACPRDRWEVIRSTPLRASPADDAAQVGRLEPGQIVTPRKVEVHVRGVRVVAEQDRGRIFAGDAFYLLDSQAEGFHRIWHYGEVRVIDATGVNLTGRFDSCEESDDCWAQGDGYPVEIGWASVRRADGVEGWVREPIETLDGVLRSD